MEKVLGVMSTAVMLVVMFAFLFVAMVGAYLGGEVALAVGAEIYAESAGLIGAACGYAIFMSLLMVANSQDTK